MVMPEIQSTPQVVTLNVTSNTVAVSPASVSNLEKMAHFNSQVLAVTPQTMTISVPGQSALTIDISDNKALQQYQSGQTIKVAIEYVENRQINVAITKVIPAENTTIEVPLSRDLATKLANYAMLPNNQSEQLQFIVKNSPLAIGQARRLPQEMIKLVTTGHQNISAALPQSSTVPLNKTFQLHLIVDKSGQAIISFSELIKPQSTVIVSNSLVQLAKHATSLEIKTLITSNITGNNSISKNSSFDITTAKIDMSLPQNQLWLRHQPLSQLMTQLNIAIKDLTLINTPATPQTAAQTVVPQTATQQTAAPQTPMPQTAAPQTAAPQTAAPQTAAPQTAAPQTAMPQTAAAPAATPSPTSSQNPIQLNLDPKPQVQQEGVSQKSSHSNNLSSQKLSILLSHLAHSKQTTQTSKKPEVTIEPATKSPPSDEAIQKIQSLMKQLQHSLPNMKQLTTAPSLPNLIEQFVRFDPLAPSAINTSSLGSLASAIQLLLGGRIANATIAQHSTNGKDDPNISSGLSSQLIKIMKNSKGKGQSSANLLQMLAQLNNFNGLKLLEESLLSLTGHLKLYQYQGQEQHNNNQQIFYFTIPTSEPTLPQVEGEIEQSPNPDNPQQKIWRLTLLLPVGATDKIQATAILQGKNVEIKLISNNAELVKKAEYFSGFLSQRLETLGLSTGEICCKKEELPTSLLKRPNQLVELMI